MMKKDFKIIVNGFRLQIKKVCSKTNITTPGYGLKLFSKSINPFMVSIHIKNKLICYANQLAGFYLIGKIDFQYVES